MISCHLRSFEDRQMVQDLELSYFTAVLTDKVPCAAYGRMLKHLDDLQVHSKLYA